MSNEQNERANKQLYTRLCQDPTHCPFCLQEARKPDPINYPHWYHCDGCNVDWDIDGDTQSTQDTDHEPF